MDLANIRRVVIIAMFSDDELLRQLTLRGGNALNLVYGLGSRASVDVDLSLEEDFLDFDDARERIFRALKSRFGEVGLIVFDEKMTKRGRDGEVEHNERFAGYQVDFKLMEADQFKALGNDLVRQQIRSMVVGPGEQRTFRVQISKFEYCHGKREAQFDDYTISVYTPEMLAIEKLRAICQQMPEYKMRPNQTPRARDFYDIYSIVDGAAVNLSASENLQLTCDIFLAKEVPLVLISKVPQSRDFHRQDWPAVEAAVSGALLPFEFYFDFVVDQIRGLESLWNK